MQSGRVIEDGPPDILMRGDGAYSELISRELGRLARQAA